ncbi:hypothetical protein BGZ60DRAFT_430704 [Tricladium varicosporioides]|nr:hypothetical protein BGZ60DRAFT_430704 [Hymenoscyphus varicosporioides]
MDAMNGDHNDIGNPKAKGQDKDPSIHHADMTMVRYFKCNQTRVTFTRYEDEAEEWKSEEGVFYWGVTEETEQAGKSEELMRMVARIYIPSYWPFDPCYYAGQNYEMIVLQAIEKPEEIAEMNDCSMEMECGEARSAVVESLDILERDDIIW